MTRNIDVAEMERTRTARFGRLKAFDLAFVDSLLPGGRKQNIKVIGKGVVENPEMNPPITEDHGFTVSWIRVPPGGGAHLHSHQTPEVFIPIDGPITVFWNDDGQTSTALEPLDCISVPTGVMRGFRNHTDRTVLMLAMVGGHTGGGSVTWHEDVLRRAAEETGLSVDERGQLERLPTFDPKKVPSALEA